MGARVLCQEDNIQEDRNRQIAQAEAALVIHVGTKQPAVNSGKHPATHVPPQPRTVPSRRAHTAIAGLARYTY